MKKSSFERVVGTTKEIENKILKENEYIFNSELFDKLLADRGKLKEKSPEELQIIDLANKLTNDIRRKYGLEDFDIPAKNIYIIKKESWPEETIKERGTAFYKSSFQAVAIRELPNLVGFGEKTFHELLHFKAYQALQMTKEQEPKLYDYRAGLIVLSRNGKEKYFSNLNEAVTEEIIKKYKEKFFSNPIFENEINQTKKIIAEYSQAEIDDNKPLFDEDTIYAEILKKEGNSTTISVENLAYEKERNILNILIDKLFEKNKENFNDREEIFELFAKGMMTGNILSIGRLIDGAFGKGTFRKIGELDDDIEAQEKFVNFL